MVLEHLRSRANVEVALSVPPHKGKADRFEGYRAIAEEVTGATDDVGLREVRATPTDYKRCPDWQKREMRKGRFEISSDLSGTTVLVMDDVLTTGSTIGAMKDAALEAGAERVIQLVFGVTQK